MCVLAAESLFGGQAGRNSTPFQPLAAVSEVMLMLVMLLGGGEPAAAAWLPACAVQRRMPRPGRSINRWHQSDDPPEFSTFLYINRTTHRTQASNRSTQAAAAAAAAQALGFD